MKSNFTVIIQARMGSTRLPGKVLREIYNKPILEYLIERVEYSTLVDKVIIATSINKKDDVIEAFCRNKHINFYRGSEDDVLSRYFETAKKFNAENIIRLCADSPLIDYRIIDNMINEYIDKGSECSYYSNSLNQSYPIGMSIEIFTMESLKVANKYGANKFEREHVTPYIYMNPGIFNICHKYSNVNYGKIRLTVDEEEDFCLIKNIIKTLYLENPLFSLDDISRLYRDNKKMFDINSHVKQKKILD